MNAKWSLVVLALFVAVAVGAQTVEGPGGIKIQIPEIKINVPGVTVTGGAVASGPQQSFMDNNVTKVVECNGDGVSVMGNHNTLTISGNCTGVQVMGNHNTITMPHVPGISVMGNHNTLTAERVDEASVSGNHNTITIKMLKTASLLGSYNKFSWEAGVEGDPTISNLGRDNVVTKAAK